MRRSGCKWVEDLREEKWVEERSALPPAPPVAVLLGVDSDASIDTFAS